MKVYLEVGKRRTFACALEWPGWCRARRTEDEAIRALVEYGPRYKRALGKESSDLKLPSALSQVAVVERYDGDATTDFGAPGIIPEADRRSISDQELDDLIRLLQATWRAFDAAAEAAEGKNLAPAGPRGGGRELAKIREHVSGADGGYARAVGGRGVSEDDPWQIVQRAFTEAIRARAHGELPDRGPRGGERWPARFAIRRSAWHALDHAWEIEDRAGS